MKGPLQEDFAGIAQSKRTAEAIAAVKALSALSEGKFHIVV